jgi:DNA-binding NarL/FixJ family response regulator
MIQHQRTMKYITLHIILLFQRQMVSAFVPFPSMIHHNYALMIGRIEGWNAYTPNSFPILMSVRTSFKHESGDNFEQNKSDTSKFETRGKEWIVLVDDEESIRNAVGNFLFDAGYVVTACSDAETLLELLSSASSGQIQNMPKKLPSVIVCDNRMPGMNGLQLLDILKSYDLSNANISTNRDLDFIRREWKKIPVVLLTAKGLTSDRIQGYKAGADVFLSKPFAPEELLSIIDNLIVRMDALQFSTTENTDRKDSKTLRDVKSEIVDIKALLKRRNHGTMGMPSQEVTSKMQDITRQTPSTLSSTMMKSLAIVPKSTRQEGNEMDREIANIQSQVRLTDTEKEVLMLLSEGYTNGDIAQTRSTSVQSVSRTISNLYAKTLTKTRTELVRWAMKMGHISGTL